MNVRPKREKCLSISFRHFQRVLLLETKRKKKQKRIKQCKEKNHTI